MIKRYPQWLNEDNRKIKLTPEQIEWCNNCIEEEWWVNDKGEVEVKLHLTIIDSDADKFHVQFASVKGNFDCSSCLITSLEGAPKEVGGSFWCYACTYLTSLKDAPKKVGNDFDCRTCTYLTSLEGAPEKISGDFWCDYCVNLTSLEGAPREVGKDFDCLSCSNLTSLEGAPEKIGKNFDCSYCENLTSLEGAPREVDLGFFCRVCTSLTSLKGAPSSIKGKIYYNDCPKLPQEEIDFYENAPDLFRDWLKTGLSLKEYQVKYKGKIKGDM